MLKQSYILNMASNELLRKIEKMNRHLDEYPESQIAKASLERYWKEEKELHQLILEAERADNETNK